MLCFSNIALNGVVFNGFLVWVDIQRRTTAENVWKEKALKHFTKEELTEAKEIIWDLAGNDIIWNIINAKDQQNPYPKSMISLLH